MSSEPVKTQTSVSWEQVFKDLESNMEGSDQALNSQFGKKRITSNPPLSPRDCMQRISTGRIEDTVSLDGSKLRPGIICLDIDIPNISGKLEELWLNGNPQEPLGTIMGHPLVVATPTEGHLHLYYKMPTDLAEGLALMNGRLNSFKEKATTRLGFNCEYCYNQHTLAGAAYKIKEGPVLSQVTILPEELFPYNYSFDDFKQPLVGDSGELVKVHSRNESFFEFFNKDNFSLDLVQCANLVCCEEPLPESEAKTLSLLPAKRGYKPYPVELQPDDDPNSASPLFQVFSFKVPRRLRKTQVSVRLQPGEPQPTLNYAKLVKSGTVTRFTANALYELGFNPDRAKNARMGQRTLDNTICYIALMEATLNTFIDDDQWMGESLHGAACHVLLQLGKLHAMYIVREEAFYVFNQNRWEILTGENLCLLVIRESQALCKFQQIGSSKPTDAVGNVIKGRASREEWPTQATGFNFLNGSLIVGESRQVSWVSHEPGHYFRRLININYDPYRSLSPFEARFLLDFTNQQVYLLNLLRLVMYFSLESGGNQVAAFITGDPGGSKSTLFALIEKLVYGVSNVTHINSFSQKFQLLSQTRGKNVILLSDLAPNSIKPDTASVLKKLISGEKLQDDVKFASTYSFQPKVFVIVSSNDDPADFEAFQDPAFMDRWIVTPAPSIDSLHRVNDFVERLTSESGNCSGLVNWALNLSADFPNNINRASDLNAIISPAKSLVDSFVMERLFYLKDSFISTKELTDRFNEHRDAADEAARAKFGRGSEALKPKTFATLLRDFRKRVDDSTPIEEARTSTAKGFKNLSFKKTLDDPNGAYTPFSLKANPSLTKLLSSDPFKNHGYLMRDSQSKYSQDYSVDLRVEEASKVTVKAVTEVSSKILMDNTNVPGYRPHTHIRFSTTVTGPTLKDLEFWKHIPELPKTNPGIVPFLTSAKEIHAKQEQILGPLLNKSKSLAPPTQPTNAPASSETKPEVSIIEETVEQSSYQGHQPILNEVGAPDDLIANPQPPEVERTKPGLDSRGVSNQGSTFHPPVESKGETLAKSSPARRKTAKTKMNNKSETASDAEAQIIEDEALDEMELYGVLLENSCVSPSRKVNSSDSIAQKYRQLFNKAKEGMRLCAKALKEALIVNPIEPYTTFEQEYPSWTNVSKANSILLYFPLYGPISLISQINQDFKDKVVRAFKLVSQGRPRSKNSYFSRALPGSNTKGSVASDYGDILSTINSAQKTNFVQGYQLEGWDGQSLFPVVYQPGTESYGRLRSLPPSNLSSFKAELKSKVLSGVYKATGLEFVELDLRACHTLVFKALATLSDDEKNKLPNVDQQWSFLEQAFRGALAQDRTGLDTPGRKVVSEWTSGQVKSVLKTQWYKALNSGSLFNPKDNLESNRNKLGLDDTTLDQARKVCQAVFEGIEQFALLKRFQLEVNHSESIYLPTQGAPFSTATASKKGQGKQASLKETKPGKGGTTVVALDDIPEAVPISYESDGLLLAGYFNDKELLLDRINKAFRPLASKLLDQNFTLEFKNPTN